MINKDLKESSEEIPKDLLHAFENNYLSYISARKRLVVIVMVVAGAVLSGWLLLSGRMPKSSLFAKYQTGPVSNAVPENQVRAGAPPDTTPQASQQKPSPIIEKSAAASVPFLPSFVPEAGYDSSYSVRKPGWERYVGKAHEFRIFRSGDRIKAVQVLALTGKAISGSFLKRVLTEITGSSGFSINSRVRKQGFLIQRCSAGQKSTLLIYRKINTGAMQAFVVSFD